MSEDAPERITLAFELAALERLTDPGGVISDTRGWTDHMGIVSDEPTHLVRKRARDYGFNPDFLPGPRTKPESLIKVNNQPEHEADRYVLVSADESIEETAESAGWEYRHVEEAAETAGWRLTAETDDTSGAERTGWP